MNHVPPETLTSGDVVVLGSVPLGSDAALLPQGNRHEHHSRKTDRLKKQLVHAARDAERRRIGRELHDDVCQRLAAIEMLSTVLMRRIDEPGARRSLWEIIGRVSTLSHDVREIAHETRDPGLSGRQLLLRLRAHALELEKTDQLRVSLRVNEVPSRLPRETARSIYRIVQEALRNVWRHAAARAAEVTLTFDGVAVVLIVEDEGVGFDPTAVAEKDGLGLLGMKERVLEAGGNFQIKSSPGEGTRVRVWIPLPRV
jgi:signal transduction histidine kinase